MARCQRARRAIAEAKQRSQRSVIGWVTKIYYLELLRALEGTLSRWSRLYLQSFVPTPVSRRVAESFEIFFEIEKLVVLTLLSVGKG
jgi:hypothetical protein